MSTGEEREAAMQEKDKAAAQGPGIEVPTPMDRKSFLVWLASATLGVSGLFSLRTIAFAVRPPGRSIDGKTKVGALAIANTADLEDGVPALFEYGDDVLFAVKRGEDITVLDAACPHVKCKLHYNEATDEFDCPCHESSFDLDGVLLGGPAPRDMIPAKFEVDDSGDIIVSGFEA
jgi:nitrite reductase/ring-hydroxylating ferredoxin subunit